MNDLDLPPRRDLPDEVRDRIRAAVHTEPPADGASRFRAVLAAAASVAVLVAAAVAAIAVRPDEGIRAGGAQPPRSGDLTLTQPDAQTEEDLDRCAAVIAESEYADKYSPRDTWVPVFTVRRDMLEYGPTRGSTPTTVGEYRTVAFREHGDKPVFCHFRGGFINVSDPDAAPVTIARNDRAHIFAVAWLSPDGMLVGVAQGVTAMESRVVPYDARVADPTPTPLVQDGLFAIDTDNMSTLDRIEVVGFDDGKAVVSGGRALNQVIWPVGVSWHDR